MSAKKIPEDPLAAFIRATGKSDAAIGRMIRVNRWKISRGRRGDPPLPIEDQIALEEFTGVSPATWAEFYAKVIKSRAVPEGQPSKKNGVARAAA